MFKSIFRNEDEDDFLNNSYLLNISFANKTEKNYDLLDLSLPNLGIEINKKESALFNDYQKYSMPNDLQNISTSKTLGRKKKGSVEKGEHTKYTRDNKTRKFKVRIEKALLGIINPKILKQKLKVTIKGKEYNIEGILRINNKEKKDSTIAGNIKLLSKSIKDFFNTDIASNYSGHPEDYNKIIINILYNSDNCKDITSILDMTFLECLKYYRKDINIQSNPKYSCLRGLDEFYDELKKEFSHDKEYLEDFLYLIDNFEKIYSEKKKSESPLKEI